MSVEEVQEHFEKAINKYGIEEVSKQSDLSINQIHLVLSGIIPIDLVFFLSDYLDIEAEKIPVTQVNKTVSPDLAKNPNGHLV